MQAITEESRWQAVQSRDKEYDGRFVFAVRSTGIYCRPSCPSRRPRREHVVFYPLPAAAEQEGFRACLRCRPRDVTVFEPQLALIHRACRHIEEYEEGPLTLSALAYEVGLSPYHLQRTFKRIIGISPRQYTDAVRLRKLKGLLKEGEPVTGAMYDAGYGSSSRLYEQAPSRLGMTPAGYRKGGAGMSIRYTVVDCSLGKLLVAATELGICAVRIGDSDETLEAGLRQEYSAAHIERDAEALGPWVCLLLEHLNGHEPHLDLPLDVRATAFQWRVWEALRAIPYGSTRSYAEVARAIGQPSATRAVAQACANNPAALIIPCHRVIRENGTLGGYRWGMERKQALLRHEACATSDGEAG